MICIQCDGVGIGTSDFSLSSHSFGDFREMNGQFTKQTEKKGRRERISSRCLLRRRETRNPGKTCRSVRHGAEGMIRSPKVKKESDKKNFDRVSDSTRDCAHGPCNDTKANIRNGRQRYATGGTTRNRRRRRDKRERERAEERSPEEKKNPGKRGNWEFADREREVPEKLFGIDVFFLFGFRRSKERTKH